MIIRVSIIEDNCTERRFYADLVTHSSGLECVSQHPSPDEALQTLAEHRPDVVLFDLKFAHQRPAYEFLPELKQQMPRTEFLILTRFDDDEDVFRSIFAGASGYCLKSEPPEKVVEAINLVSQGGASMSSVIARKVLDHLRQLGAKRLPLPGLSPRHSEILRKLSEGQRYIDIARDLHITYDTVRAHIRKIYEKLHVHSRGEAVAKYFRSRSSQRA